MSFEILTSLRVAALAALDRKHGKTSRKSATLSLCSNAATGLFALVVLLGTPLPAAENDGSTWARYFPDRTAAPADEAGWAELAKAFPNRVKRAPALPVVPLQPPPATQTEMHPGIDYVRVRQLASDLATIEIGLARPRLIVDLRYVRGDLDEALQFGALLARRPLKLEARTVAVAPKLVRTPGQVTLCLINRATAGPLEAVLDALQHAGDVLLVGTQSAGDTGSFVPAANAPDWRVIADDFRRANGTSLLDVGVTPALFVETVPDIEDAAYLALDAGRPAAELLDAPVQKMRFDEARLQQHFDETRSGNGGGRPASSSAPEKTGEGPASDAAQNSEAKSDGPPPFDRSLQRAISTLIAHSVLRGAAPGGP